MHKATNEKNLFQKYVWLWRRNVTNIWNETVTNDAVSYDPATTGINKVFYLKT
jgi:hypothetical protein